MTRNIEPFFRITGTLLFVQLKAIGHSQANWLEEVCCFRQDVHFSNHALQITMEVCHLSNNPLP